MLLAVTTTLLLLSESAIAASSPCFESGVTWKHAGNLLGAAPNVEDPKTCQTICANNGMRCQGFTWYTDNATNSFASFCFTFSGSSRRNNNNNNYNNYNNNNKDNHNNNNKDDEDDEDVVPCMNCYSGPPMCQCSGQYGCSISGDNILALRASTPSESECQEYCLSYPGCRFYTWFGDGAEFSNDCVLLSDCDESEISSAGDGDGGGISGPVTCSQDDYMSEPEPQPPGHTVQPAYGNCSGAELRLTNGTLTRKLLAETSQQLQVVVESGCRARLSFVLVGGGGGAVEGGGGGGSGFVFYNSTMIQDMTNIDIVVGGPGVASSLTISNNNMGFSANPGVAGGAMQGGEGYSGGGAISNTNCSGTGGSNGLSGGNGEPEKGGKGSGFSVSDIRMENFSLSPGQGGPGCCGDTCRGSGAGGGGGVLVNGQGPAEDRGSCVSGGGEGACGYGHGGRFSAAGGQNGGAKGVVLLEIQQL